MRLYIKLLNKKFILKNKWDKKFKEFLTDRKKFAWINAHVNQIDNITHLSAHFPLSYRRKLGDCTVRITTQVMFSYSLSPSHALLNEKTITATSARVHSSSLQVFASAFRSVHN